MQITKTKIKIFSMLLILSIPFVALAEISTMQGVGQINFSWFTGPSSDEKQKAIELAKVNALNKYSGDFTTSKMLGYEKIRSSIESNIDRYVMDYKIIDDVTDKDTKTYRVVVEASINVSLIEVELQKASAVQQTMSNERSYMSFVFVARKVVTRKSFETRVSQRAVEEIIAKEKEEAYAEGESAKIESESIHDTNITTGGSALQKSDEVEYDVSNSEDINSAMSNVFSTAGYEVIDADYLETETAGLVKVKNFIEDFKFGNDISGETRKKAIDGCRSVNVNFFAIGTLDVGAKDTDQVTGLTRVYVTVNGKILDLRDRFPKTIASVGPIQYAGLGPDQAVANRNALKLAGESAANDLTAQLRAKNVK